MKNFILTGSILFLAASSFAAPIEQAVINGDWNNATTWSLNRVPQNGDSVVIPGNKTVTISSNLNLSSDNIKMGIYGKLSFVGPGSKLDLAANSRITVYPAGLINADGNGSSQSIKIGNNTVFTASDNSVAGPQLANSSTIGFVPFSIGIVTLPVKFESFTLSLDASDVLIEWSTTQEINSATYEVEKSTDAKNWNTIAYIMAAVNSSSTSNYNYKDKELASSVVYYRIKEVDQNGQTTYTSIKSVKNESVTNNNTVKIASNEHTVFIQFQQKVRGNVMVRFISLTGQIISQQVLNQPVGQVTLNANSNLRGNYIISVSNGQDLATAKQIIL